jgi:hypothetical protein
VFKITKLAATDIKNKLTLYLCYGINIYSTFKTLDDQIYNVEHDGQSYKITLKWAKSIVPTDPECRDFLAILYKSFVRDMGFERAGRSMFNPKRSQ